MRAQKIAVTWSHHYVTFQFQEHRASGNWHWWLLQVWSAVRMPVQDQCIFPYCQQWLLNFYTTHLKLAGNSLSEFRPTVWEPLIWLVVGYLHTCFHRCWTLNQHFYGDILHHPRTFFSWVITNNSESIGPVYMYTHTRIAYVGILFVLVFSAKIWNADSSSLERERVFRSFFSSWLCIAIWSEDCVSNTKHCSDIYSVKSITLCNARGNTFLLFCWTWAAIQQRQLRRKEPTGTSHWVRL